MKSLCVIFFWILISTSCSHKKTTKIPKASVSAESTKIHFRNKDYSTIKVGLVTGNPDKPVEWMNEMKDTASALYHQIVTDGQKFGLHFLDNNSVEVKVEDKKVVATYTVDDEVQKGENEGTKLRLQFPENTISDSTNGVLNYHSLLVKGVDGRKLLLEIPRNYDNKAVVLLMKSQEEK